MPDLVVMPAVVLGPMLQPGPVTAAAPYASGPVALAVPGETVALTDVSTALPPATAMRVTVKNTSAAAITITADGTDLIEGAASVELAAYASVTLYTEGSSGSWYII